MKNLETMRFYTSHKSSKSANEMLTQLKTFLTILDYEIIQNGSMYDLYIDEKIETETKSAKWNRVKNNMSQGTL